MEQNNFFKTSKLFIILLCLMSGLFSAQNNATLFFQSIVPLDVMKVDASSGNLYVAFGGATQGIKKLNTSGTDLGNFGTQYPGDLATDANGNIYYCVSFGTDIKKVDSSNNTTLIYTALMPKGVAFDNNKLYYSEQGTNTINVIDLSGSTPYTPTAIFTEANSRPSRLYIAGGYLYAVLDGMTPGTSKIIKIDLSNVNATPIVLANNLMGVKGVVTDGSNIYYAALNTNTNKSVIYRIHSSVTDIIDDGTNGNTAGIGIDSAGNIYYTSSNFTTSVRAIYKISAASLATTNVAKKTFAIFPNPAKDFVTISNLSKGAEVALFDVTGKLLYQTKSLGVTLTINTSSYKNGMYLVKVDGQAIKLLISK